MWNEARQADHVNSRTIPSREESSSAAAPRSEPCLLSASEASPMLAGIIVRSSSTRSRSMRVRWSRESSPSSTIRSRALHAERMSSAWITCVA